MPEGAPLFDLEEISRTIQQEGNRLLCPSISLPFLLLHKKVDGMAGYSPAEAVTYAAAVLLRLEEFGYHPPPNVGSVIIQMNFPTMTGAALVALAQALKVTPGEWNKRMAEVGQRDLRLDTPAPAGTYPDLILEVQLGESLQAC